MNERNIYDFVQPRRARPDCNFFLHGASVRVRCRPARPSAWKRHQRQATATASWMSPQRQNSVAFLMTTTILLSRPMKQSRNHTDNQPDPRTPGVTRRMVRSHARHVFRDVFTARPLTEQEWLSVEADLVRRMENNGL